MKRIIVVLLIWILTACTPVDTGPEPAATQPPATPEPAVPTPTAVPVPTNVPPTATAVPAANTADLLALVQAGLPENAYDGLNLLPLTVPQGERPLWAVHSVGLRDYGEHTLGHFVAIYTFENGGWQPLARLILDDEGSGDVYVAPDYLFEGGVAQAILDEANIWLTVEAGVGAHGGTFQLLRFDGRSLSIAAQASAASPGVGSLDDLNGDGVPEVIMGLHDYYVFCYACGVRYLNFQVFAWDAAGQQMNEVTLASLPENDPASQPANRAVQLAQADLWPEALAKIEEAQPLSPDNERLAWDAALIRLYRDAWQSELNNAPYPLLTHVFAGDYAGALDIMRGYTHEQIFNAATPLIQGSVAEGYGEWVADAIASETNAAIAAVPDLAAAYYLRAWAAFLQNPADPQIEQDLATAASLDPDEPLYTAAAPAPIRIQFAPGAVSATVSGALAANQTVDYILRAMAGQTMDVVIASPTNNVLLTIVGEDGIPLTNGLMSGAMTWRGPLPATQDYILRAIGTFDATSYTMTVMIE